MTGRRVRVRSGFWLVSHVRIVTLVVLRVQYLEVRLCLIAIMLHTAVKRVLNFMHNVKLAHIVVLVVVLILLVFFSALWGFFILCASFTFSYSFENLINDRVASLHPSILYTSAFLPRRVIYAFYIGECR